MKRICRLATLLLLAGGLPRYAGAQPTPQAAPPVINGPGSTLSQLPRPRVLPKKKIPYGLQLMARFDMLPLLRESRCVQDSSYDRNGGNGDLGNFVRRDGNKAILSDIRGPGCIYRFWSANANGQLRIYFDGEDKPRIDCPMQDLFLGKVPPFAAPLVGHKSGGWYCFFPMPFQKSCRIEVENPGAMYYHVEYQLYPDDTAIRTFTVVPSEEDQKALDTVTQQWTHLGRDPKTGDPANHVVPGTARLAAGATQTLTTLLGPAEVSALRIKVAPADRYTLRQTLLRVYWDGAQKPAIEAPVGDFFGIGFGDQRYESLPAAMTDDGFLCYWPMPFAKQARFELVNTGKTDLPEVSWNLTYHPIPKNRMRDAGYFHAQWHRQTTVAGEPFHILNVTGRGHYVGEHTDMQGDRGIGFLEGDEKIYRDGETFPGIYGTGTEDFYTGGWYFDEGPFNLAYHGCTVKSDAMSRVSAYRYQIQDCVPFSNSLIVDIEHGGMNDYPGADYSCVAYWYQTTPEHDWSPINVAQLTPAHMKIGGVLEAEDLNWMDGKAAVEEDKALPDEASGGKVVHLDGGTHTVSFDVKTEDVYTVGVFQPVAPGTERLSSNWWLDDNKLDDAALKQINEAPLNRDEHNSAHTTLRLKPGAHTLGVYVPDKKSLYLDYINLEPSRKEKGVIEGESLLDTAKSSGTGKISRADADYDWSGGSALVWEPQAVGETLILPVTSPLEADYVLELGAMSHPNGIQFAVAVDNQEIAPNLDTYTAKTPTGPTQRIMAGRVGGLKQGAHTITFTFKGRNDAVKQPALWLDFMALRKSSYPNTIEAELLKILEAKDGEATHQEMAGFGGDWSNDDQFWFLGQKEGAEATLELPIAAAQKYKISAYYTTARDYAIVQVLIDGQAVGAPTDCYTPNVLAKGKTELGTVSLSAGTHRLTFRAIGKNSLSTGYLIGVDAVGLEPIP